MALARSSLTSALGQLGLGRGDVVMVHASVRAVGRVYGGPDEIHLAIESAVGPEGTVVMYVGCQEGFDDVGRGVLTSEEEAAVLAHQPACDPQTARASRDFGILAEFFRSYPGTLCSSAVGARMAARGAAARWLTEDQPWNYAYGRGSPLEKLCTAGGKVLLLGSDHDQVTLLHYAEHVADFSDKRVVRYQAPVLRGGVREWVECEEYETGDRGVHPSWPDRFFATIVDDFVARHGASRLCSSGRVGSADTVLFDAAALVAHALPIMVGQARGQVGPAPVSPHGPT